jgi:hypothetical protein
MSQPRSQSQWQGSDDGTRDLSGRSRGGPFLLSRYAECLFWLARYMERVENLARILDVTETFVRHGADQSGWVSIVQINADEKRFLEKHDTVTPEKVLHFYLTDRENPSSIAACLFAARENARTLRPMISTEMWTQINVFYNRARELMADEARPSGVSQICAFLKEGCQFHTGITEGTMFRDQGWAFYSIGKYLECGDQTSRLVDIKYLPPGRYQVPHAAALGSRCGRRAGREPVARGVAGGGELSCVSPGLSQRHDAFRGRGISAAEPFLPALDRAKRASDRDLSDAAWLRPWPQRCQRGAGAAG